MDRGATLSQIVCKRLVGREEELGLLNAALAAASERHGSAIAVTGEAGVGKSRLVAEIEYTATNAGFQIMRGRGVADSTEAYRPITEALLAAMRTRGRRMAVPPELAPFLPVLGRLIPEWRRPEVEIEPHSTVLLGEAILRLLRVLGQGCGCVLTLEDLHWADADTLAVVEYLADNVAPEPVVLLVTIRSGEASDALARVRTIAARHSATIVELARLDQQSIRTMARWCLESETYPEPVAEMLEASAEGLPFLVEELLAAWVRTGALHRRDGAWEVTARLVPVAPVTFADSIRRRLRVLGDETRDILAAAAVLGRQFDWSLLAEARGLTASEVLALLRRAIDAQLIDIERHSRQAMDHDGAGTPPDLPCVFRFRHALTRDAVLDELLPPERQAIAARLLAQIERAHPDLPGHWCDLAARLAESAGARTRAVELLLESGRRALAQGALAGAERMLDRCRLLHPGRDELSIEIDNALLEVLALAGDWQRVGEVGDRLLASLGADPSAVRRTAEVHLHIARAALAGRRLADAAHHLDRSREAIASEDASLLFPRLDALAGLLGIEQGRLDEAAAFARAALDGAERSGQPKVACEALEVLGRCARVSDLDRAEVAFERARAIAEENGLTVWRLRAMHELGTLDIFRVATVDRLRQARDLAMSSGALATTAMVEMQIAAYHSQRAELEATLEAAGRAEKLARRLHLDLVAALALCFGALVHALTGNRAAMEEMLAESAGLAGDEPIITASIWECRAFATAFQERWSEALQNAERAVTALSGTAATAPGPLYSLWALLRTVEDIDGASAREVVRSTGVTVNPTNAGWLGYSDAIALGRLGRAVEAEAAVARGDRDLIGLDWCRHLGRRLVAECAITDGWGDPATWLWGAYTYFEEHGNEKPASACKSLLRRIGAATVETSRRHTEVPIGLRRRGITQREAEVLSLLAEGLSNKEIGQRLYLSPRTVEKHVASLLAKTETRSRTALASWLSGSLS